MDTSKELTIYKQPKVMTTKMVVLMVIISLGVGFFGGIAGGVVGLSQGMRIASLFGVDLSKAETVTNEARIIQEDSQTIDVVKNASPSVVSILIKKEISTTNSLFGRSPFEQFFPLTPSVPMMPPVQGETKNGKKQTVGGGSGFIISADGMILTNHHVVSDTNADYVVVTNDGKEHPATVLASDSLNDIAIIKINETGLTPLELDDADTVQIGQTVIAIGNTLGEFRNTVTRGVISGMNRVVQASNDNGDVGTIYEAIQTDAAINPGNSGGPLLNLAGKVVGINTAVSREGQSIGFAIPVSVAKRDLESVKKHGKIVRPWLGIRYQMVDQEYVVKNNLPHDYGAVVVGNIAQKERGVVSGSPAEKAGIVEGDIILEVDGVTIDDHNALAHVLSRYEPNQEVTLKVFSQGNEKDVRVTLGEFNESSIH
ncbi:MAG: trypsin-like peptidase domain-containing protein [Patescibacteria group bacterium]